MLPLLLSPTFRSDVLEYSALLPRAAQDKLRVHVKECHSFWVGARDNRLLGTGRDASVGQSVALLQGPACGRSQGEVCPLEVNIYDRRNGFPRTYRVGLERAPPESMLFLGGWNQAGLLDVVPGFRPDVRWFRTSLLHLGWGDLGLGELPAAALSVLSASSGNFTAFWNREALPVAEMPGGWWHVGLDARRLAEACWCDRAGSASRCLARLRATAGLVADQLHRSNQCTLEFRVGNKTVQTVAVGDAASDTPTVDAFALEAAYDDTSVADNEARISPEAEGFVRMIQVRATRHNFQRAGGTREARSESKTSAMRFLAGRHRSRAGSPLSAYDVRRGNGLLDAPLMPPLDAARDLS